MKTVELQFVSKDRGAVKRVSRSAKEYIMNKGYGKTKNVHINSARRSQLKQIARNGSIPNDPKDNWMRDIFRSTFDLVDEQDGSKIFVANVAFQERINLDGEKVVENIYIPNNVIVQKGERTAKSYSPGNKPFTYDPARDYYTEPGR